MFGSATKLYCGSSPNGGLYDPASKLFSTPIGSVGSSWTEIPLPAAMHVQKPVGNYNPSGFYIGSSIIREGVATSDGKNTILVTSNFSAGIWRYVEPGSTSVSRTPTELVRHSGAQTRRVLSLTIDRNSLSTAQTGTAYDLHGQRVRYGGKGVRVAAIVAPSTFAR
jgi:hypothetical protein